MKLYEIPAGYRAWLARIEENGGEVTEMDILVLDQLERNLQDKSDSIVALAREAEYEAAACREEANYFLGRARVAERRRDRLKAYLLEMLRSMGWPGVRGQRFNVSRATAARPTIRWTLESDPPEEFRRTKIELDGTKAHDAYDRGVLPAGFEVKYSEFLRIR